MNSYTQFLCLFLLLTVGQVQGEQIDCAGALALLEQAGTVASRGQVSAYMEQGVCFLEFKKGVELTATVDLSELDVPVVLRSEGVDPDVRPPRDYIFITPTTHHSDDVPSGSNSLIPVPSPMAGTADSSEYPEESVLSPSVGFTGTVMIELPQKSAIPDYFPVSRENLLPYSSGCYSPGIGIAGVSDFIDLSGLLFADSGIPGCDVNHSAGQVITLSAQPREVPKGRGKKGGRMGRNKRKDAYKKGPDDSGREDEVDDKITPDGPQVAAGGEGREPPEDRGNDKKGGAHALAKPVKKKEFKVVSLSNGDMTELITQMAKLAKKSKKPDFIAENNLQQFHIIKNILARASADDMRRIQGMSNYQALLPHLEELTAQQNPSAGASGRGQPRPVRRHQHAPQYPPSDDSDDED